MSIDANLRMNTNAANRNTTKLIYPELSYSLVGICFDVHNQLGRFARERQYGNLVAEKLTEANISYGREKEIMKTGNRVDFLIEDKIVLEIKAKPLVLKEDFYQLQRYLQASNKKLGMIVNFRNRYLKPIRIIKIETAAAKKFV